MYLSIWNTQRAKNSTQAGNKKGTLESSDPFVLWQPGGSKIQSETERICWCKNTTNEPKWSCASHLIKDDVHSGRQTHKKVWASLCEVIIIEWNLNGCETLLVFVFLIF